MRHPPLIIGNWKMYKTVDEALDFVKTLAPLVQESQARIGLAVPFTALHPVVEWVERNGVTIWVGAQNASDREEGALTGEISPRMVRAAGGRFVLIGHSERRQHFGESNALINRKVHAAFAADLSVVLCIGESAQQRERQEEREVLKRQLLEGLEGVADLTSLTLAYEPVWAIGTGKVAHPTDAQSIHAFCRALIGEKWGSAAAEALTIQYGGSVKTDNAQTLLSERDIDGLLVGGASLDAATFAQITNSARGLA